MAMDPNPGLGRRGLLMGMGAAGLAAPAVLSAQAQGNAQGAWPNRPVKLVVPYAPGGASDTMARPWAEKLTQAFGQPFVIDNRGGAAGTIGAEAVVRGPPDGYTFLFCPNSILSVVPQLRKVSYDPRKDLTPVGRVGDLHCGFVIRPDVGPSSIKETVEYARKNPGKVAYGSSGLGTSAQLRLEMFKLRAGIDILHVPYRGSADAMNDLLAGTVQMMNEIIVLPHVKAGKLKLLCINHALRNPEFPDAPTLTEAGYPDSDVPIWYAVQAPSAVSKDIIATFNRKIVEIARTDDMIRRLREVSVICPTQTPEEIVAFSEVDFVSNGKLIREANVKLE